MATITLTTDEADLVLLALAHFSREQIEAGAPIAHANQTIDLYRQIGAVVRGPEYARLPHFTETTRELLRGAAA